MVSEFPKPSPSPVPPFLVTNPITHTLSYYIRSYFCFRLYRERAQCQNPHKRRLFFRLSALYTPWMAALPIATILEQLLDPWVRDKITAGVSLTTTTAAFIAMSVFLWHTRAEKHFSVEKPTMPDLSGGLLSINHYEQL